MADDEKLVRWQDFEDYHKNKVKPKVNGIVSDVNILSQTVAGHTTKLGEHDTAIGANTEAIKTLNGADTVEGSVLKTVKDAINTFATTLTDDNAVNTYAEALQYIQEHGADYTALLGQVTNNTTNIGVLQSAIEEIKADLKTQATTLQAHTASISSLQGQIDEVADSMPTYTTSEDIKSLNWD